MPSKPGPVGGSVWVRPPRTRGERPALSREQLVRAAIEILDAEGLGGLSVRRLGGRLGVGSSSLSWHVRNKDELLELAMDEVMAEVAVPAAGDVPWRAAVSDFTRGMHAMLLRHPWVIGRLGVQANIGPNSLRLADRAIAVLRDAGFDGAALAHANALLMAHAVGTATSRSAIATTTEAAGITVHELVQEFGPYLESRSADYPDYYAWWRQLGGEDPARLLDDNFAWGLERILDGLERWRTTAG